MCGFLLIILLLKTIKTMYKLKRIETYRHTTKERKYWYWSEGPVFSEMQY